MLFERVSLCFHGLFHPQGVPTIVPGRGFDIGDRVGLLLDLDEAKLILIAAGRAAPPAVVGAIFITPGLAMVGSYTQAPATRAVTC